MKSSLACSSSICFPRSSKRCQFQWAAPTRGTYRCMWLVNHKLQLQCQGVSYLSSLWWSALRCSWFILSSRSDIVAPLLHSTTQSAAALKSSIEQTAVDSGRSVLKLNVHGKIIVLTYTKQYT